MKILIICLSMIIASSLLYSQSTIVYDAGTNIDVGTGADVCAGTITVNGTYSGDGAFCNGPLPVELVSFNATAEENNVELKWKTETEVNDYGFDIERAQSSNVKSQTIWKKIGFVQGNGNSNSPKEYSYVDKNPIGGNKFHYRLKQIDNDGKFEYSNIVEVTIFPDKFELSQNYPNPFNPDTKIRYAIPNVRTGFQPVRLIIFDVLGNEVAVLVNENKEAGYYETKFDGSALASGLYIYRLTAGNFVSTKKMLMIK